MHYVELINPRIHITTYYFVTVQQGPVKRHLMNTFNGGSFPGSAPFNFPPNFPFVNGLPVRPQGFLQVPYQTGPLRFQ